jgi:hypothetical protein
MKAALYFLKWWVLWHSSRDTANSASCILANAANPLNWLRQFDDDARIEVAFLLLKRLAEKGFINEGAKSLALARLEEMVRARRLEVGKKAWKIERGRLDNLLHRSA